MQEDTFLIAIYPKIPAFLSLLGSFVIIQEVTFDKRSPFRSARLRHGAAIQRVLVAMSVYDLFASMVFFLSTWAMPKESRAPFAIGNQATCTAVGFFYQVGLMGTYANNCSLAMFCYIMVKMSRNDFADEDRVNKIERWCQRIIFVVSVSVAVACIPLQLYNPAFSTCHIEATPPGCQQSWQSGVEDATCERGDNAFLYSLAFNVLPLWICVVLVVIAMVKTYRHVLKTDQDIQRLSGELDLSGGEQDRAARLAQRERASRVGHQAIFYVCAFLVTYLPVTIAAILWMGAHLYFRGLHYVVNFCLPLQGFLNFLVFARERKEFRGRLGRSLYQIGLWLRHPTSCLGSCFGLKSGLSSSNYEKSKSSSSDRQSRRSRSSNQRQLMAIDGVIPDSMEFDDDIESNTVAQTTSSRNTDSNLDDDPENDGEAKQKVRVPNEYNHKQYVTLRKYRWDHVNSLTKRPMILSGSDGVLSGNDLVSDMTHSDYSDHHPENDEGSPAIKPQQKFCVPEKDNIKQKHHLDHDVDSSTNKRRPVICVPDKDGTQFVNIQKRRGDHNVDSMKMPDKVLSGRSLSSEESDIEPDTHPHRTDSKRRSGKDKEAKAPQKKRHVPISKQYVSLRKYHWDHVDSVTKRPTFLSQRRGEVSSESDLVSDMTHSDSDHHLFSEKDEDTKAPRPKNKLERIIKSQNEPMSLGIRSARDIVSSFESSMEGYE